MFLQANYMTVYRQSQEKMTVYRLKYNKKPILLNKYWFLIIYFHISFSVFSPF